MKPVITDIDILNMSKEYGIKPEYISTFAMIESSGKGFNDDDTIKLNFEAHRFYFYLENAEEVSKNNPDICYKGYKAKNTFKQSIEYSHFERAKAVNKEAAYKSVSLGKFQIMGDEYKKCGFQTPYDMYSVFDKSEVYQLTGFMRYCTVKGIANQLKLGNIDECLRLYNGAMYKPNGYPEQWAKVYPIQKEKWLKILQNG